jgi:hypothetical protein
MKNMLTRFVVIVFTSVIFMQVSNAATVTWTLTDVVFSDGGLAAGSFAYDADSGLYSDLFISTTSGGGTGPGGEEIKPEFGGSNGTSCATYAPASSNSFGLQCQSPGDMFTLVLAFESELTNDGGIALLQPGSGRFGSKEYLTNGVVDDLTEVTSRGVIAGSIVASAVVPLPAAVWLFTSGVAGLGFLLWRKSV